MHKIDIWQRWIAYCCVVLSLTFQISNLKNIDLRKKSALVLQYRTKECEKNGQLSLLISDCNHILRLILFRYFFQGNHPASSNLCKYKTLIISDLRALSLHTIFAWDWFRNQLFSIALDHNSI